MTASYRRTTSRGSKVTLISVGMTKSIVTVVSVLFSPDPVATVGDSIISSTGMITGSPSSVVAFSYTGGMTGGIGEGGGVAGTTESPVTVALVTFTMPPVRTCSFLKRSQS